MAERNTIGGESGRSQGGKGHRRSAAGGGSVDLMGVRSSQENIAASMVVGSNRSKSNAMGNSMFARQKTDVVGMKSVLTVSSNQRNSTENLGRSALLPGSF